LNLPYGLGCQHVRHQADDGPALQGGGKILLRIPDKACRGQMPPPVPNPAFNLNEQARIPPRKIRSSPTGLVKPVFTFQPFPACGIPQQGKAFFLLRAFSFQRHITKRLVKH